MEEIKKSIKKVWDYHNLWHELNRADFILVMGSADERVAIHAAYLMLLNYSDLAIVSGGFGKVTMYKNEETESENFAKIMIDMGVNKNRIIIENQASNSGENLLYSKRIVEDRKFDFKKGIIVTKPYMKRRAYATAMKQWQGIDWLVSSPMLDFDMYVDDENYISTINLMVGDLHRIITYPQKGFQIEQIVPDDILESLNILINYGFDKYIN